MEDVERYEHLPIYKTAMDLAVLFENQVRGMGRYHTYALGAELRRRSLGALSLVVRANSARENTAVLDELRIVLEETRQLLFLAKETKALSSFGFYKEAMERVESLSRQNEGWRKSEVKRQSNETARIPAPRVGE